MTPLPSELRSGLDNAITEARDVAEAAAEAALTMLAVAEHAPFATMDEAQRRLRRALRARSRQLGGGDLETGLPLLAEEIAYEQWHRMLFARFLAENSLLMHPEGVSVTLQDCAELAPEEGAEDAWDLAARYASDMLPGIFRTGDPAVQIRFAPEGRHQLERIVTEQPALVFTSDDGLGWVYQFWQSKKKDEVNRSGRKIGGADIAPVTQLFTENYMVRFLLDNSLGAWWAARHPDSPLVKTFAYLRFREDGTPAAGTFPGWPDRAAEVTVMDPCCGSGHFLVVAFPMLWLMRMEEDGLGEVEAADAVLRDNLFGLELDPRCTQIAAFALTLEAWKVGGYRDIPLPNVACSGIRVEGQLETWLKLAGGDYALEITLERLYLLFRQSPDLGSLINPGDVPVKDRMFVSDYSQVEPLLQMALQQEQHGDDPTAVVFGAAVAGVARAARLMAKRYTLVATNVPYLGTRKQGSILRRFLKLNYFDERMDLSTAFLSRCRQYSLDGGAYAVVTPENWLFTRSYERLRKKHLREQCWHHTSWLGSGAFETITGEVVKPALSILTNAQPRGDQTITGIDASVKRSAHTKSQHLLKAGLKSVLQSELLKIPNAVVALEGMSDGKPLGEVAKCAAGMATGDSPRFYRFFWEQSPLKPDWEYLQGPTNGTKDYSGRHQVVYWQEGRGDLYQFAESVKHLNTATQRWRTGQEVWRKLGVVVNRINLDCTLYTGERFDQSVVVVVPDQPSDVPAIWSFSRSSEFTDSIRLLDRRLSVTPAILSKIPFDLDYWRALADKTGGLPKLHSDEPTQWLFRGNPHGSTESLLVAVARLLGYHWPQQKPDDLDASADTDGVVCLPPVAGEQPAAERLRSLLAAAYGDEWSQAVQDRLLAEVGYAGKGLGEWLRDGFFEQHCKIFQNRPFIWHIWDGRRDGFSALVNYHKLDSALLDRLIYTYLGDWIRAQRDDRDAGVAGADGRLVAALELQTKLEAIQEGEPPYDIYVRWKLLDQQPIGWNPDLNDGVRLNVRPFVTAEVLRRRFNVHWRKDRGKNPDGSERHNDLHLSRAEKQRARKEARLAGAKKAR